MKAKRSYSTKNIRRNYTYTPEEIGELFNIASTTVFRWISKEGLKRIEPAKKYYVHSSDLKIFIVKKSKKHKVKCKDDQIYCMKCRAASNVKKDTIKVKKQPNKTVWLFARCALCGGKLNKYISEKKFNLNHPLFIPANEVNNTLNTEGQLPLEYHIRGELKND